MRGAATSRRIHDTIKESAKRPQTSADTRNSLVLKSEANSTSIRQFSNPMRANEDRSEPLTTQIYSLKLDLQSKPTRTSRKQSEDPQDKVILVNRVKIRKKKDRERDGGSPVNRRQRERKKIARERKKRRSRERDKDECDKLKFQKKA
ncbi:hypothetical protein YC2023_005231 [Brassica napus]